MPPQSNNRLVSIIGRLALLVASTVAFAIPLGYSVHEYLDLAYRTDRQALVKAGAITSLISANPRLWSYQVQRMQELIASHPVPIDHDRANVYDARGSRLLSVGEPLGRPVIKRSRPVYDSGRIVGRVEIEHSLRGYLFEVALAALLGLMLGAAVYGVLLTLPRRALRQMSLALDAEHAALRASEERYRTVADFTYDWEYWRSPDGSLPYVSPSCLRVTGYRASEFQQDPALLLRIVHPEDRAELDRHLHAVEKPEANTDHYELDFRILTRAGEERWIAHVCQHISDEDGKYLGRRACNRDITERKQVEQAHKSREAELREAQRIAGIGSWEWVPATDVITWSEGLCLILRRNPNLPTPTFEALARFYTPASWGRLGAAVARALDTGAPYEIELEMIREDGTSCWTTTRGEVVRAADGAVAKLRGTVYDIDAHKRAEADQARLQAQLRESQKMEALGTLAGGVAHDFNNIIAAITGNLELAWQDLGPEHAARESLEEIRKANRRAKALVQQILAFGRRQGLARKVMSLAPVVEESARLLRTTLLGGVTLNIECAADAPAVLADATQIQQVLLNLCSNAWQAMRSQGRPGVIEVRLEAHRVDAAPYSGTERRSTGERVLLPPGRWVRLMVRDNGPGMDEATRSRVFEPFFTTKAVGEGTGLGLAVVHGIVQAHEARIVVHSEPGKGATFSIYFPAAEASVAAAAEQEPHAPPKSRDDALVLQAEGKHILYVDDDDAIVFLMARLLARRGYRVSGHTDAHEAVAAVRAEPGRFDLAVTDYNMPGMSGLELARALREIRADLPVVVVSGYITEELRAQSPAAGARNVVFKPDTVEELCGVVARLANGEERTAAGQTKA